MSTQTNQIKEYLNKGYRLTALDALDKFKCFRLASRISELKQEGYTVDKVMIETESGARIAEYYNTSLTRG
jgi:hypothetical protein|tara:strand:+ start:171 stop:383 length:213 start_codon:yes stop_codon:yes gene_type:complete